MVPGHRLCGVPVVLLLVLFLGIGGATAQDERRRDQHQPDLSRQSAESTRIHGSVPAGRSVASAAGPFQRMAFAAIWAIEASSTPTMMATAIFPFLSSSWKCRVGVS